MVTIYPDNWLTVTVCPDRIDFQCKDLHIIILEHYELREDRPRRGRMLLVGLNQITVMNVKVRVQLTLEQATKAQKRE